MTEPAPPPPPPPLDLEGGPPPPPPLDLDVRVPRQSVVVLHGRGQTPLRDLRTLEDFAEAAHVKPGTVYAYRARGYLPEPIGTIGTVPVWSAAQVRSWLHARPGQGRPRPPARRRAS